MSSFALNPDLKTPLFKRALRKSGRVQVETLLAAESARHLHEILVQETRWNLVSQLNGKHVDLDAAGMETISAAKRSEFLAAVHQQARNGFQYLYENFPLYDVYHRRSLEKHPLFELFEFLNSGTFLDFARTLTGFGDIGFADAQATRFRCGHFLTSHDDAVPGKQRRAAYVLNLTPDWRPDWGGQLLFFDEDGDVTGGFSPGFNVLNVFTVPVSHSVAMVTPFAGAPRYSVTGWLRAGADPGP